jgi:hypothetical protein
MTRDHTDVLQNIEFALVSVAKGQPEIDDHAVLESLNMSIKGRTPDESTDPKVAKLYESLESIRAMREDVSDAIWAGGLKTIAESVQNHSGLAPGEKGYLDFVSKYVR